MRRLMLLLLLAGALVPASAMAEPVGSPFRFGGSESVIPADDEVGATGGLSLASAVNGYVLASWTSSPRPTSSTTQVLGRTGPLEGPRQLAQGSGAVAANTRLRRYLRVSEEVTDTGGYGVFTQRLRSNGTAEGPRNTIQTSPGSVSFFDPDAVYNPRTRQYLVVGRVGDESGVFGQGWLADERGRHIRFVERCCTGTHAPEVAVRPSDGSYLIVNTNDFQDDDEPRDPTIGYQWISSAGAFLSGSTLATTDADARVAVNTHTGEALVVWSDGSQVIARRIGADGLPSGGELALSQVGEPSDPDWRTGRPDVAYNAEARQFLVVWQSGPRRDPAPIGDHVYGQHLDGSGREIGPNDFRISEGDRAQAPRVSTVRSSKDWLVAWGDPTGVARQVTATARGTTPDGGGAGRPAAPTGLRASLDGARVLLSWDPSTDPDFAYFAVRRDSQPNTSTATWARLPGSFTSPSAEDTPGLGQWWYYVTQVNTRGRASPKSAAVRVDIFLPPPPIQAPPPPPPPPAVAVGSDTQTPVDGGPASTPAVASTPTSTPAVASATPAAATAEAVVQGTTPVVAAPVSAPSRRAVSAAQALRQARTALRRAYKTAFSKGKRFRATCRRSAATQRTCTVSWRYKRFSYKGRVVVRLSGTAYSTTVSVKRTPLRG